MDTPMIDLAEIAHRSGLPHRTIRYVVEKRRLLMMFPDGHVGRGIPRRFLLHEAVAFAVMAHMVENGIKHRTMNQIIDCLSKVYWWAVPKPNPLGYGHKCALMDALTMDGDAELEFGDGKNIRLSFTHRRVESMMLTTGWIALLTGKRLTEEYCPIACLTVDVGRIRDAFVGRRG